MDIWLLPAQAGSWESGGNRLAGCLRNGPEEEGKGRAGELGSLPRQAEHADVVCWWIGFREL